MSQELNIPNIPRFQSLNIHMEIQMSGASPNVLRVEYPEYPEISISEYPYGNSNVLIHLPMSQELNIPNILNIPNMPNIPRFQSLNIHMEIQMS